MAHVIEELFSKVILPSRRFEHAVVRQQSDQFFGVAPLRIVGSLPSGVCAGKAIGFPRTAPFYP